MVSIPSDHNSDSEDVISISSYHNSDSESCGTTSKPASSSSKESTLSNSGMEYIHDDI